MSNQITCWSKKVQKEQQYKSYQILEGKTMSELSDMVNNEMESGWQPIGGVNLRPSLFGTSYIQSMVKNERDDDSEATEETDEEPEQDADPKEPEHDGESEESEESEDEIVFKNTLYQMCSKLIKRRKLADMEDVCSQTAIPEDVNVNVNVNVTEKYQPQNAMPDDAVLKVSEALPARNESHLNVAEVLAARDEAVLEVSEALPMRDAAVLDVTEELPMRDAAVLDVAEELPMRDVAVLDVAEAVPMRDVAVLDVAEELPMRDDLVLDVAEELPAQAVAMRDDLVLEVAEELPAQAVNLQSDIMEDAEVAQDNVSEEASPVVLNPNPFFTPDDQFKL